jgi:hypothetical protein
MWFQSLLQLLSTAAVVGAVTPFVLPCLVPILLLFGLLYLYFQASVRELRRLDSLARSPIFTAVGNALTVRLCVVLCGLSCACITVVGRLHLHRSDTATICTRANPSHKLDRSTTQANAVAASWVLLHVSLHANVA